MSGAAPPLDIDVNADQRGRIIGTCVSVIVITDIFVFFRLLSRKLARAGYWWDDFFAVLAMIASNACGAILLAELRNGYGRHIYIWPADIMVEKVKHWLQVFIGFELMFHTATTLSKYSILFFYYRIFPVRPYRSIFLWTGIICTAYMIAIDAAILAQCRPLHYAWDQVDGSAKGTCFDVESFFKASGGCNVVLNFLVFVLPIPLLWRLKTTSKQQIVLSSIFTLAGFVVLVSIIWVAVVANIKQVDVTWSYIDAGVWSCLEPNMAVVCACLPSLRPLVTVFTNGVFRHPLIQNTFRSTTKSLQSSTMASRGRWSRKGSTVMESGHRRGAGSEGRFSPLDEVDDMATLGYGTRLQRARVERGNSGVSATGGGGDGKDGADVEMIEVPQRGINVKTHIVVSTSDRLDYNDRLF